MVLFVGELLADLITEERFQNAENFVLKIGGSPGNIARYSAQLGVPSRMLSRVGNDPIGGRILKRLAESGVDVSFVQEDNIHGTTLVFVQKTPDSPDFFVIRGADQHLELANDEIEKILEGVKIVHFSCWMLSRCNLYELTMRIVKAAFEKGISVSFDPNCRDKLFECGKIDSEKVMNMLRYTTYSKPSLDDAIAIFKSELSVNSPVENEVKYYIERFHQLGVKYVVLTAGKMGAYASDGNTIIHIPPSAKKVIDATGAGDGFWAGMYYALTKGYDFFKACEFGSKVAGHIVGFVGADVPLNEFKVE
ncbi:carbohydrate kinase family protein [Fervidobacterium gondwanense]|uniref:Fructokinase n=1 Tax=Fervidobacterium gondwanense DSM 13020 TaxID=1121883 RepID=A0A1M7RRF2_FERGO|nr:sugar kinase [Fervidobacterium gondwanense]SHN48770.1 fructokinase [Fervidobacterium gondwanense DSM 13020]